MKKPVINVSMLDCGHFNTGKAAVCEAELICISIKLFQMFQPKKMGILVLSFIQKKQSFKYLILVSVYWMLILHILTFSDA